MIVELLAAVEFQAVGSRVNPVVNPAQTARDLRREANLPADRDSSNQNAAAALRSMLVRHPGKEACTIQSQGLNAD